MTDLPDYASELSLLTSAAAEAGRIAMRYFGKDPKVSWKEGQSPVTEADFAANDYLHETLMAARPDYGWLSEETLDSADRLTKQRTFIIDPIDGTKAFIAGRDLWCVSVALVENGHTIAGVLDCPARGDIFTAVRGRGSYLNGRKLNVGAIQAPVRLAGAKTWIASYADQTRTNPQVIGHIPSLAYRIAAIADDRFDGTFIKPDCCDWDIAAAELILSEAGGRMCDIDGASLNFAGPIVKHGFLIAAKPPLIVDMLAVVANAAIS